MNRQIVVDEKTIPVTFADISERLLSSGTDSVRFRTKRLCENALRRMTDVRETLNGDAATARAYLAKHVEKIVMELDGGMYVASGG